MNEIITWILDAVESVDPALRILIAGLAIIIGFIGAVLGVGGGFMLVPALIYFFRIPPAWN